MSSEQTAPNPNTENMSEKLIELTNKFSSLESEILSKNELIEDCKQKILILEKESNEFKDQSLLDLQSKDLKISELQSTILENKTCFQNDIRENEGKHIDILKSKEIFLFELQQNFELLKTENSNNEITIKQMQENFEIKEKEMNELIIQLKNELNEEKSRFESELLKSNQCFLEISNESKQKEDEFLHQIETLKFDLETSKANNMELNLRSQANQTEIEQSIKQINSFKTEIEGYKLKIDELEKQNMDKSEKITTEKNELIQSFVEKEKEYQAQIILLKLDLEESKTQIKELEKENTNISEKMINEKDKLTKILCEKEKEYVEQISNLKFDLETSKSQIEMIKDYIEQINLLKKDLETSRTQNNTLNIENKNISEKLMNENIKLEEIIAEKEKDYLEGINILKLDLDMQNKSYIQLEKKCEKYQHEISEKIKQFSELEQIFEKIKDEKKKTELELINLKGEILEKNEKLNKIEDNTQKSNNLTNQSPPAPAANQVFL